MVQISVIIPTYKDWERLALCLQALEKQSFGSSNFEVIVVNNLPGDLPPAGFSLPSNALLLHEPTPGSYAARNAGIGIAKGEILAFTDSDCIPDKDWLKNSFRYFVEEGAERIGGNVEIFYQDPQNKTLAELYESVFAFNQKRNVQKYQASITANCFIRKELFHSVGNFDQLKMSGEDFGWNMRASDAGHKIVYADDVVVGHPARRKLSQLATKSRRVFGGKKKFNFRSIKGIVKEFIYLPYLFLVQVLPKMRIVFFENKELILIEKARVAWVVLFLFAHTIGEYFRLMVGKSSVRI